MDKQTHNLGREKRDREKLTHMHKNFKLVKRKSVRDHNRRYTKQQELEDSVFSLLLSPPVIR